jgi:uncharacterized protein YndB with AHSA1/START domain
VCSAEIDRPAEEVFAYVTDPSRFSEWQEGVVDGHLESPQAPTVGTKCYDTRRIGRAKRTSTSEITHIDPPHRWGVQGIDGPVRATVAVTVEALSLTRSRVTISVDFTGHGIGKILVPFVVRREASKEMPINMRRVKERLEQT